MYANYYFPSPVTARWEKRIALIRRWRIGSAHHCFKGSLVGLVGGAGDTILAAEFAGCECFEALDAHFHFLEEGWVVGKNVERMFEEQFGVSR